MTSDAPLLIDRVLTSEMPVTGIADLAQLRVIIAGCTHWVERPGAYVFISKAGPQDDVKVSMTALLDMDSRLRAALKNFGGITDAVYWLLRTLDLWADPTRILILETAGRGYDVQTVTDLQEARAEGFFALTGTAFLLSALKSKKAWVPRTIHECVPFRSEVTAAWLEQNFPGCTERLGAGATIGVSGDDMASLLYDRASDVDEELPDLGLAP